jgi:hypothetical protein
MNIEKVFGMFLMFKGSKRSKGWGFSSADVDVITKYDKGEIFNNSLF